MGIPVWKKCCCCSIPIACLVIGILGVINSIIKLYNAIRSFIHFQDQDIQDFYLSDYINRLIDLILGAFGLAAFGCLIFREALKKRPLGGQKHSEKLQSWGYPPKIFTKKSVSKMAQNGLKQILNGVCLYLEKKKEKLERRNK